MGLEEFVNDKSDDSGGGSNKQAESPKCHSCGTEGEHIVHVQYRCPNSDCEVISWYEH